MQFSSIVYDLISQMQARFFHMFATPADEGFRSLPTACKATGKSPFLNARPALLSWFFARAVFFPLLTNRHVVIFSVGCPGGIAQLVERLVRNEKARGSNPLTSSLCLCSRARLRANNKGGNWRAALRL